MRRQRTTQGAVFAAIATLLAESASMAAPLPLFENSDFEKGTLANWTTEGDAFKTQPTKGDNPSARGRSDNSKHQGDYWIGGYEAYTGKSGKPGDTHGDGPVGRLTSAGFKIEKDFINFLVGGGPGEGTTVRLLVDGKTWLLSPGFASETMQAVSVEVKALKGKTAQIVLLDNVTGGWGHVNADDFTASDKPLARVIKPQAVPRADLSKPHGESKAPERVAEIKIDKRYIIYPIKNGAPKPGVSLSVDGKVVRFYTAELATSADDVDWWAYEDVSEFKGKTATLAVAGITEDGFGLIRQSDTVPGQEAWGDEPRRPQFHVSQKVGWNNDPNGMVHYKGEWHYFIQHNPVGWKWGNMTWAHTVSKDLVNWTQLPNTLHHRKGDAMFSGGGAVDWKNTGGWKTGDNDVIILTWTSTGRGECIAYSNDKGRSFTEYEGNPVIKHKGRDPKPIWYSYGKDDKPLSDAASKLGGHWVIAVYDEDPKVGRNIALYTSTDLKQWDLQSKLPGYYECAELFSLPVDPPSSNGYGATGGKAKDTRWVIFAADARYAIGKFDGREFTPEHEGKHQLHWGNYYASQLFSDAPDGRRIQVGWARIDMPGMPFNQTSTFPTELTLRNTSDGVRMFGEPAREIEKIHGSKHRVANKRLSEGKPVSLATSGALFDIRATFEVGDAQRIGLNVDGRRAFLYDAAAKKVNDAALEPVDGKVSVQLLIDRPMMETFVNNGRMVITSPYQNDLDIASVEAFAEGGKATLVSLEVNELQASWK